MEYFKFLPRTTHTFPGNAGASYDVLLSNITSRAVIAERLKQTQVSLQDYIIRDEQRPDTVSQILYNTPNYTWVILMVNNIFTLYDWPLTNEEFDAYIISKYGSTSAATSDTNVYWMTYGTRLSTRVDATTYNGLAADRKGDIVNSYDQEIINNDAKRRIKVVPAASIPLIVSAFRSLFV